MFCHIFLWKQIVQGCTPLESPGTSPAVKTRLAEKWGKGCLWKAGSFIPVDSLLWPGRSSWQWAEFYFVDYICLLLCRDPIWCLFPFFFFAFVLLMACLKGVTFILLHFPSKVPMFRCSWHYLIKYFKERSTHPYTHIHENGAWFIIDTHCIFAEWMHEKINASPFSSFSLWEWELLQDFFKWQVSIYTFLLKFLL